MRTTRLGNWIWRFVAVAATLIALVLGLRILQSERAPDLGPWHTWAPREPDADAIGKLDWPGWLAVEDQLNQEIEAEMRGALEDSQRVPANRYFEGSPLFPGHFKQNWNRSYELLPSSPVRGAVVLLHGLSDSPYSLRHVAQLYRDHGFAAVGLRLPGHGTVPAGLTSVHWQDWRAAVRLAMREARRVAGPGKPIHLIGFSTGGALAVQYSLDALGDSQLDAPSRVVLFSPLIGLTPFARYAGVAGWPALLPRFSKSAWLDIVPEFNPFKYNSFPVNAARQAYDLTQVLDQQLAGAAAHGSLGKLPPIQVFQSVVDSTVAGEAVFSTLFALVPANGSEIVLFDVNRATPMEILLSRDVLLRLDQMLPRGPQRFRITVLGNSPGQSQITETVREAGTGASRVQPLALEYPRGFFSLSHVALTYPPNDSLYGTDPQDTEFGVHLGNQQPRGERSTLIRGADTLVRASCNPFFPYVITRLEEGIK
jgi:alpha-beta hydrolase superfamily lysophospholipase